MWSKLVLCSAVIAVFTQLAEAQDPRVAICEQGDYTVCNSLGIEAINNGRFSAGVTYFQRVCDGGIPIGCSNLAEQYHDGRGVTRDLARSMQLFAEACRQEVPSGCAGICISARANNIQFTSEQSDLCNQMIAAACDSGNPWMCDHRGTARPAPVSNGCRTGGEFLAQAYVRSNPMYAWYFGDLESYVATNRSHFGQGGDAARCAEALAQAALAGGVQSFDPTALQRQQELNTRLGTLGISPGQSYPMQSDMLVAMAQHFAWLATILPAMAQGNPQLFRNPQVEP